MSGAVWGLAVAEMPSCASAHLTLSFLLLPMFFYSRGTYRRIGDATHSNSPERACSTCCCQVEHARTHVVFGHDFFFFNLAKPACSLAETIIIMLKPGGEKKTGVGGQWRAAGVNRESSGSRLLVDSSGEKKKGCERVTADLWLKRGWRCILMCMCVSLREKTRDWGSGVVVGGWLVFGYHGNLTQ